MDGWSEVSRTVASTPVQRGRSHITALQFDTSSDLLWVGDTLGYTGSWTPNLVSYTKFKSSSPNYDPQIRQILNNQRGIFSLSAANVNFNNRCGISKATINATESSGLLSSMDIVSNGDIYAGSNSGVYKLDLIKPETAFTNSPVYNADTSFIKNSGKFLVFARKDGQLEIFDPSAGVSSNILKAHSGSILDIDVRGNYAATCGCSVRRQGEFMVDPLVFLFDFRMMKPLSPIAFPAGASFVRFHPKLPNFLVVASNTGHFQFIDMYDPSKLYINQAERGITHMDLSASGEYLAFSLGSNISLWSYSDTPVFNAFPTPLDQPDAQDSPLPFVDIDDMNYPLNSIGLPYYKEHLLSNWPSELKFTKELAKLPARMDNVQERNPHQKYINHLENPYYSLKDDRRKKNQPKFISERVVTESLKDLDIDDVFSTSLNSNNTPPNCYLPLQIHYSRFGVEDFDFSYFNKTQFSGLENHLDNAYINSLIQLYRYTPPFYNAVTASLIEEYLPNTNETIFNENNPQGSSIITSLGYLFDMMHIASGKNITISNFSTVLSQFAPFLVNVDDAKTLTEYDLRSLIIKFNKFLLQSLSKDSDIFKNSCQLTTKTEALSTFCKNHEQHQSFQFTLDVPPKPTLVESISAALYSKKSVRCQQCQGRPEYSKYHHLDLTSSTEISEVISINIGFRPTKDWLVPSFDMCDKTYKLIGYVCSISHASEATPGEHNLVSYISIDNKWYLFNDFLVMEISEQEVFDLTHSWKKPVIAIYCASNEPIRYIDFSKVDSSILYRDHFAGTIREGYRKEYKLLTQDEAPKPGSLVAIDAEFVSLEPEELEIWGLTGSRHVTKPRKLSLARISVIRGEGPMIGVPFIDDYIVHTCGIYDYLTSFSGIEPGDLYPGKSAKNLVTLQTAYRRLWLLLGIGCIFIGHGLYNDFRTINLSVPKNQIRDTGEFYYLPENKRKLSLKFLAYVLLRENVQTGNHDSIEDARTALFLYKKYLKLKEQGDFEQVLNQIYIEGQHTRFRVPDAPSTPSTPKLR